MHQRMQRTLLNPVLFMLLTACTAGPGPARSPDSHTDGDPVPAQVAHPLSPLSEELQPGLDEVSTPIDLTPLRAQVSAHLEGQDGVWGVHVVDLYSGSHFGINEHELFPAASTLKLPVVMYALEQVRQGRSSLDEILTYSPQDDYEEGTGVLVLTLQEGDGVTLEEAIELSIRESDNVAVNMMIRRFGWNDILSYIRGMGGEIVPYKETYATTPAEMASYLRKALRSPERSYLFGLLTSTAFTDRTEAGVPDGVPVAHKIGTLPGSYNDVALVLAPRRPFVISVFSREVWDMDGSKVITDITAMVYKFQQSVDNPVVDEPVKHPG